MNEKPPREGARWGDDPVAGPIVTPEPSGPSAEYIKLCNEYGEANLKHALKVHAKVQHEYPHLAVVQRDPLIFSEELLEKTKIQITRAASDGRSHSMPETLSIMESNLGALLVQNSSWQRIENIDITFGDENEGKAAQKADRTASLIIIGVIAGAFAILIAVFGFEDLIAFIVTAVVVGSIFSFFFK